MEGVTEELREQSEKGQDEIGPTLVNDTLPVGKDDPSVPTVMDPGEDETEPPPDWLEPLEDCDDEGDEGVEIDRSSKRRSRRGNNTSYVLFFNSFFYMFFVCVFVLFLNMVYYIS